MNCSLENIHVSCGCHVHQLGGSCNPSNSINNKILVEMKGIMKDKREIMKGKNQQKLATRKRKVSNVRGEGKVGSR
jgi:hypothetical protein